MISTGSRQPYHGIFPESIKYPIVQKICHSHLIEEACRRARYITHFYCFAVAAGFLQRRG